MKDIIESYNSLENMRAAIAKPKCVKKRDVKSVKNSNLARNSRSTPFRSTTSAYGKPKMPSPKSEIICVFFLTNMEN